MRRENIARSYRAGLEAFQFYTPFGSIGHHPTPV